MKITVTFHPAPGSIAERLAATLGRTPTNAELAAEIRRILATVKNR